MAKGAFRIQGFEGLQRELREAGQDAPKVIRAGMRAAAVEVRKKAKANLAGHRDTGELADSLKVSTRLKRATKSVTATVRNTRRTYYGMFLEFGTIKQHPVRWLTRALRDNGPEAYEAAAKRIRARLLKIKIKRGEK